MRLRREIQQVISASDVITALRVMAAEEKDADRRTVLSIAARLAYQFAMNPSPATHFYVTDEEPEGPTASRWTFSYTKPKDEVFLAGNPAAKPEKQAKQPAPRKGK